MTSKSSRRAAFVLFSGNPGGISDWARLVGYVDRMDDEGKVRVLSRLEEKSDLCLNIDFADDDFAKNEYKRLKNTNKGTFMGKLEVFSSPQDAELAMKQMQERFPLVNYVFYEASVKSEE